MILIRAKIISTVILMCFYSFELHSCAFVDMDKNSDALLCRTCGHDITVAANLNNIGSKHALRQRNDTVIGVKECLIQLFKNPLGQHFELITATSANIRSHGEAFEEHSWFPGYAWRVAVCPQCGAHVGWSFEDLHQKHNHGNKEEDSTADDTHSHSDSTHKKQYTFVGLIYPNLIQKHYADSLIMTPKAYRS